MKNAQRLILLYLKRRDKHCSYLRQDNKQQNSLPSILKISMEGESDKWKQCDEDAALNIPLVREHEERQISCSGPNTNIVTTSFLKTCFNGLNALSGNTINLSLYLF